MKNIGQRTILSLIMIILIMSLNSDRGGVKAEERTQSLQVTHNVKTFEELETVLKKERENVSLNIVLKSDILCKDRTLYIGANTNLNLNGHTLLKKGGNPLFYIGNVEKKTKLALMKDVEIKPLQDPKKFIVEIKSTQNIKKGQRVYLSDGSQGEMNIIDKVLDEKRFLLKERPHRIYKSKAGYLELFNDEKANITIQNGQIKNQLRQNGTTDSGMDETIKLTKSRGEKSIIVVDHGHDIELSNIKITNENYNQNNIAIMKSENISVNSCHVEGGRNAVIIDAGSSLCKVLDNTFYDCSGGIYLFGSNNIITDNVINSSGATLNSGDGITILKSASFNNIKNNQIIGGNCYGIWALKGKRSGNNISDNVIQANVTYGIYLESGEGYLIQNNRTERNSGGICAEEISNSNISGNYVTNNLISGISIGEKSKKCIIQNNILSGNNYVDPEEAGYGGDIVLWGNPKGIIQKDNITEQKTRNIR